MKCDKHDYLEPDGRCSCTTDNKCKELRQLIARRVGLRPLALRAALEYAISFLDLKELQELVQVDLLEYE